MKGYQNSRTKISRLPKVNSLPKETVFPVSMSLACAFGRTSAYGAKPIVCSLLLPFIIISTNCRFTYFTRLCFDYDYTIRTTYTINSSC